MNLIEAMEEAVAERGEDYVYPKNRRGWTARNNHMTCLYVTARRIGRQEPACIVGAALNKMGASLESLNYVGDVRELFQERGNVLPVISQTERLALSAAQYVQDQGNTWGEALVAFKERLSA